MLVDKLKMVLCITFLLFIVGYVSGQSPPLPCGSAVNATCNQTILDCCEYRFRAALNLNTSVCQNKKLYEDPVCYRNQTMFIYFVQGVSGAIQVCDAWNSFLGCLDKTIRSCTTYGWYMEHGLPDLYNNIFFQQLTYMCGAGLDSYLNNQACMNQAFLTNFNSLMQCVQTFSDSIGSPNADVCVASSQFTGCFMTPFVRTCGVEPGWYGCEWARKSTHVLYPACDTICTGSLQFS